jgi:pyruvate/2-oxoglutarate dehydrogenase complex dihydrolipoamide acyltransferase (E2) component
MILGRLVRVGAVSPRAAERIESLGARSSSNVAAVCQRSPLFLEKQGHCANQSRTWRRRRGAPAIILGARLARRTSDSRRRSRGVRSCESAQHNSMDSRSMRDCARLRRLLLCETKLISFALIVARHRCAKKNDLEGRIKMAKAAAKKPARKAAAKKPARKAAAKKPARKAAAKKGARKVVAKKATRKAAVKKGARKAAKKSPAKKAAGKKKAPVKRKKAAPAPMAPPAAPAAT